MSRNKKKLGQRLQYKFDNYIIEILAKKNDHALCFLSGLCIRTLNVRYND